MKNFSRALSAFILSLLLIFTFTITAYAAENTNIDYADFFEQAMTVPIKEEEVYIGRLRELFAADNDSFLDALAEMDDDTITLIVFMWIDGMTYDEISDLREIVNNVYEDSRYARIVAAFDDQIGLMQYIDMMEPYMQYENPDTSFSIPFLRRFIDLNIQNKTFDTDEAFNQMLASAYESDPAVVAEILSDYSQTEIETLAKCVAADYVKSRRSSPDISSIVKSTDNISIVNLIQNEIHGALNPEIESGFIEIEPPTANIMSTCIPTIGTMRYTTSPLMVGQSEILSITFNESSNISYARQWYVEIYQVKNSTYTLLKAQTIGISPGAVTTTLNFNISFSSPGTFYTHVKVYSEKGGTLLTSRTSTSTDTVDYYWYINVNFSTDRSQYGTLQLRNSSGSILLTADCLGRSAQGLPATEINGHTPTGSYRGVLRGPDDDSETYGPYKFVKMTGYAGQIVNECSARSGILIHGGRSQSTLQPTDGCIRVFNDVQSGIQEEIERLTSNGYNTTGYVFVTESS